VYIISAIVGGMRLGKNHNIICKHKMGEIELAAMWVERKLRLRHDMRHEAGKVFHSEDKE